MTKSLQMTQLTVICANVSSLLRKLNAAGIGLHHISIKDELTASFYIRQHDHDISAQIIERAGGRITNCVPATAGLLLKEIKHRPALLFGCALILLLTVFLPTRVLFITVSGNEQITQRQILEAAEKCGVKFGAERHEIRSERVKNHLLTELPKLKWVGINTNGCVATISVQERTNVPNSEKPIAVSSIIASCDGVIQELTVRSGKPVCRVGQAVKKGQLLVSGYSDCGRCIFGTHSDAEIFAQTNRVLQLSTLTNGLNRMVENDRQRKIGLIIGKKRINFYKGSGISDATCVRMYMEYPVTLPGGFQLPVALSIQEEISYRSEAGKTDVSNIENVTMQSAKAYMKSQMVAGRIIREEYQSSVFEESFHILARYTCNEMIAQTRNEEIVYNYEQTD